VDATSVAATGRDEEIGGLMEALSMISFGTLGETGGAAEDWRRRPS
jgi:hypothetical protein